MLSVYKWKLLAGPGHHDRRLPTIEFKSPARDAVHQQVKAWTNGGDQRSSDTGNTRTVGVGC